MSGVLTSEQRTIRDQRERIDTLEEELRQAKERPAPVVLFPKEWGLCRAQERALHALYSAPSGFLTHEGLFAAIFKSPDAAPVGLVRVHICHLRRLLRRFGIEITTRWGAGYQLTPASKSAIKAGLERMIAT